MSIYDIIDDKKRGVEHTIEDLRQLVEGYVSGNVPDYQMSAWLMAVYFNGMTDKELVDLTKIMAESGEQVDLSEISGIKVDKHSTGGVGDKVTLVVSPIVAACGGKVAKMSGRGLGFTGGTIDKLESIPGFETELSSEKFHKIVNDIGISIVGQSANIAPADKKLYALRDVTATVDSIPLIASSIMSKKIASGSDKIVLDVTVGSGAFMKNKKDAVELAKKMVAIGEGYGRETVALLTGMDVPLGIAVGNILEIKEVIEALRGNGPEDLMEVCEKTAAIMLSLSGTATEDESKVMIKEVIDNGKALKKFKEMVHLQSGDVSYIDNIDKFKTAGYNAEFIAERDGYVGVMNTEDCGRASVALGAGRLKKDDIIDMTAGIRFFKKTGDFVKKGETLACLYSNDRSKLDDGYEIIKGVYHIEDKEIVKPREILGYVDKNTLLSE